MCEDRPAHHLDAISEMSDPPGGRIGHGGCFCADDDGMAPRLGGDDNYRSTHDRQHDRQLDRQHGGKDTGMWLCKWRHYNYDVA